tara:strand:+ start:286174 stop:288138 length:1965 start_codon:yes stop_codon:yes gene_type:complete
MISVGTEIYIRPEHGIDGASGAIWGRLTVSEMGEVSPGQWMVDLSRRCQDGVIRRVVSGLPFPFTASANGRRSDGTSNVAAANAELQRNNPQLSIQLQRFRELAKDRKELRHAAADAESSDAHDRQHSAPGDLVVSRTQGLATNGCSRVPVGPSTESDDSAGHVRPVAERDLQGVRGDDQSSVATLAAGHVVIVDLMNVLVAAYHVGQKNQVHAVRSLLGTVRQLIEKLKPETLLFAAEGGHGFRRNIFPEYKATRPETEPLLKDQIKLAHDALTAIGWPVLSSAGYEDDDVLATVAERCKANGVPCTVVTTDKDMLQLLPICRIYHQQKKRLVTSDDVQKKYNIGAGQMGDLLSLWGDRIDNVPGVPGIGKVKAAELLNEFENLDAILVSAIAHDHGKSSMWAKLKEHRKQALLSRRLVDLQHNVPLADGWQVARAMQPRGTWVDSLRAMSLGAVVNGLSDAFQSAGQLPASQQEPQRSDGHADLFSRRPATSSRTGNETRSDQTHAADSGRVADVDDRSENGVQASGIAGQVGPETRAASQPVERVSAGGERPDPTDTVRPAFIGACVDLGFELTGGPDQFNNWTATYAGQRFILHGHPKCQQITAIDTGNSHPLAEFKERANATTSETRPTWSPSGELAEDPAQPLAHSNC